MLDVGDGAAVSVGTGTGVGFTTGSGVQVGRGFRLGIQGHVGSPNSSRSWEGKS